MLAAVGVGRGQPDLLGGGAHQHHRRAADDFDGGDVGEVADIGESVIRPLLTSMNDRPGSRQDSKWSPAPTASRRVSPEDLVRKTSKGTAVRSRIPTVSVLRVADGETVIGRHRACHEQGLSASGGFSECLLGWCGRLSDGRTRNEPGGPISTETRVNERIRVPESDSSARAANRWASCASKTLSASPRMPISTSSKLPGCQTAGLQDHGLRQVQSTRRRRRLASLARTSSRPWSKQKLRPKIDPDYQTKKGHVIRFLEAGRRSR